MTLRGPERDLHALGRDPERDHMRAVADLHPVEHHRRPPHVVRLSSELERTWPDAASSLRDGMPETLTRMWLGIAIERHADRVKLTTATIVTHAHGTHPEPTALRRTALFGYSPRPRASEQHLVKGERNA
jgi:hypothetical protein